MIGIKVNVGWIFPCQGVLNGCGKDTNTSPPKKMQHSPYRAQSKIYGAAAQNSMPTDNYPLINDERKKLVQQIIGTVLYYRRSVDLTVLPVVGSIASEQDSATENTKKKCTQLLDYLATHDNDRIRYHASDMVLNIHYDASYLS